MARKKEEIASRYRRLLALHRMLDRWKATAATWRQLRIQKEREEEERRVYEEDMERIRQVGRTVSSDCLFSFPLIALICPKHIHVFGIHRRTRRRCPSQIASRVFTSATVPGTDGGGGFASCSKRRRLRSSGEKRN